MKKIIGIYCGSFNPMHKGHLSIYLKATKIFEEVVIAVGINSEKQTIIVNPAAGETFIRNGASTIQKEFPKFKVRSYDGFLTNFLFEIEKELNCNTVVIRGLRNGFDLNYEMNFYRFLQDLKPDIQLIYIPCDREFEHISSSAIRAMEKIEPGSGHIYLAKSFDSNDA